MNRVDDMPGYLAALFIAAVMALTTYLTDSPLWDNPEGPVCLVGWQSLFPSRLLSALTEFVLLWLVSVAATRVNRHYNVEEGTSALPSTIFLLASACVPSLLGGVSAAMLMPLVCILSLRGLFKSYEREYTAREMFLVATLSSFGSMIQYAFIPLGAAVLGAAAILGEIRVKSLIAFIFGLITPYLLVVGFGLVDIFSISIPFIWSVAPTFHYTTVITAGITALTALMLTMQQAVTPPNRSSRSLALNRAVNTILLAMIAMMAIDWVNFPTYIPTVGLLTGFAVASLGGDRNNSAVNVLSIILAIIYIVLFIIAV